MASAFAALDGKFINLLSLIRRRVVECPATATADEKNGLLIACGEGAIGFKQIQAPGKENGCQRFSPWPPPGYV